MGEREGNRTETGRLPEWREAARAEALRLGFGLVGFATAEPLGEETRRRWERWLRTGRAGEMKYLERETPRRAHPRDLMPQAESVVVVGAGYFEGEPQDAHQDQDHDQDHDQDQERGGKIARYARGKDYHLVLRERLSALGAWIERSAAEFGWRGAIAWRAATDSAPLDERALAARAGLGFIGKNTLLLHPERGSWMLLAELLVSVPFPPDEPLERAIPGAPIASCGACRKCLEACPTGALVGPYDLDPRRCISYLTIEQRGAIPDELAARMEGWAFGCDICQEVCPFNARPLEAAIPELRAAAGAGAAMRLEEIEAIPSEKAFARKWRESPISRAGRKGMIRNLKASGRDIG